MPRSRNKTKLVKNVLPTMSQSISETPSIQILSMGRNMNMVPLGAITTKPAAVARLPTFSPRMLQAAITMAGLMTICLRTTQLHMVESLQTLVHHCRVRTIHIQHQLKATIRLVHHRRAWAIPVQHLHQQVKATIRLVHHRRAWAIPVQHQHQHPIATITLMHHRRVWAIPLQHQHEHPIATITLVYHRRVWAIPLQHQQQHPIAAITLDPMIGKANAGAPVQERHQAPRPQTKGHPDPVGPVVEMISIIEAIVDIW